jgi:hypothetical protein|tara:strand:- start:1403 stop:1735 length:333 start_codon:yes stop_codon:yes gene_type:complete
MSEPIFRPDNWVVLKVALPDEPVLYKVLAGWSATYTGGSSWRMNSGISIVFEREETVDFYGHSGSLYVCDKSQYRLRMNNIGTYNQLKKQYGDAVEMMPEDTDWKKLVNL